MEIQFEENTCRCLKQAVCQTQDQEQTQEVRLTESMPDIKNVLCAWGQVLIRSKQWGNGSVSVSGGVMVWVLYAPEDESQCRSVETWVPFQMKWDIPDSQHDGAICVQPLLVHVDARSISARKMMVRTQVRVHMQALEPVSHEMFSPGSLDPDIQLLKKNYPAELPLEAGEKQFALEEEVNLGQDVDTLVRYTLSPEILEQKVMAGRLVFRGQATLTVLYMDMDGQCRSTKQTFGFSQYTELDRDYGNNAQAHVMPICTGLELERQESGNFLMKASLAAQYVIYDRVMLDITEDAYSIRRPVELQRQALQLPIRLDSVREDMVLEGKMPEASGSPVDIAFRPEHPVCRQNGDMTEITVSGQIQMLYRDDAGKLASSCCQSQACWEIPSDPENLLEAYLLGQPQVQAFPDGDGFGFTVQMPVMAVASRDSAMDMVSGLEIGQAQEKDPQRPSLILCRAGENTLWEIAKQCGSTVEAICSANQIQGEPESGKMLLIPIA